MAWRYETEHPKRKHGWDRAEAGFEVIQDVPVGKCPNGFSGALAESLLNSGVPFHNSRSGRDWPDRIYVVHEGVLYRATPTNPGRSYHGFPELPSEFNRLPSDVREAIWGVARESGQHDRLRQWLDSWRYLL